MRVHEGAPVRRAAETRAEAGALRTAASSDLDGDTLANWRDELLGPLIAVGTAQVGQAQSDARDSSGDVSGNSSGRCSDCDSRCEGDGALFTRALDGAAQPSMDEALGTAAEIAGDWIACAASTDPGSRVVVDLEFSVESLSLGPLQGRVSITRGRADVELQAFRPATAALLRARQPLLQQMVRRDSCGDVELRIL